MQYRNKLDTTRVLIGSCTAVVLSLLALWLVYRQIPDKARLERLVEQVSLPYFVVGLLLVCGSWLADTARLVAIAKSLGYRPGFWQTLGGILAGNFLTLSTPFLAGGAPAVAYALHLEGLTWADAASVVIVGGLASQLALSLLALASLWLLASMAVPPKWIGVLVLFALGYAAFMVSMALLAYFYDKLDPKARQLVGHLAVGRKVIEWLRHLNVSFKTVVLRGKLSFVEALGYAFLYFFMFFGVAPMCFMALGMRRTWWNVMAVQVLVHTLAGITPTPGGSGASELGAFFLLGRFGGRSLIGAYVLLWRACTFFFNLVAGLVGFVFLVGRTAVGGR
ncbi:MAG: lysylphosphatidylglycerol synthase transmembrane domain-containing protein [Bacillota bacterium]